MYLSKCKFGGWVTFTAHLSYRTGANIYSYSKVKRFSNFGYGKSVTYNTYQGSDLLISAVDSNYYSVLPRFYGSYLVIHDPTELTDALLRELKNFRLITIRKTVQKLLLDKYKLESMFIPHPFYEYPVKKSETKEGAVCISRVDWDKHTDIILKSNKISKKCIDIYGSVNRLYAFKALEELGFNDYYKGEFEKSFEELSNILSDSKYMVDMSAIKNDGGGTQYTFLEGIHNDCCLVLNKKWIIQGGDFIDGVNCLAVKDEVELANIIDSNMDVSSIVKESKKLISEHGENWRHYEI